MAEAPLVKNNEHALKARLKPIAPDGPVTTPRTAAITKKFAAEATPAEGSIARWLEDAGIINADGAGKDDENLAGLPAVLARCAGGGAEALGNINEPEVRLLFPLD